MLLIRLFVTTEKPKCEVGSMFSRSIHVHLPFLKWVPIDYHNRITVIGIFF